MKFGYDDGTNVYGSNGASECKDLLSWQEMLRGNKKERKEVPGAQDDWKEEKGKNQYIKAPIWNFT